MSADRKNQPAKPPASPPPAETGTPATAKSTRKAWVPKSPAEIVLDQIKKQEDRVSRLQVELDTEKQTLTKLRKAKEIFESAS